jgi:hypothetical protein
MWVAIISLSIIQALRRMTRLKILFSYLKTTFQSTQSIILRTSCLSLFSDYSSRFLGRKRSLNYVLEKLCVLTAVLTYSIVRGDHTRTIQVSAPSVGGLMKFAVKSKTCLGCKVPIKTGMRLYPLIIKCSMYVGHVVCTHCKPRIEELYLRQVSCITEPFSEWYDLTTF